MANRYYQAALGAEMKEEVVEAGSSSLAWVEVAITYDATNNSKQAAINSLRAIEQYILADNWPPA